MANNPTTPTMWNFPLPLVVVPSSNPIEQSQHQQQHQQSSSTNHGGVSERKQRTLRLSINARERRRMHDLNDALDELRSVVRIREFLSMKLLETFFLSIDSLCTFTICTEIKQDFDTLFG